MSDDKFKTLMNEVERASKEHDKVVDEVNRNGNSDRLKEKLRETDRKEREARKKLDDYMRNKK